MIKLSETIKKGLKNIKNNLIGYKSKNPIN